MRDYRPPRPTGSTPEARTAQAYWDSTYGQAAQFNNSSTAKVDRTTRGLFIKASTPGGGGAIKVPMVITGLYNADYIGATKWNPSSNALSGGEILIAKTIFARMIQAETIDAQAFTYDYFTDNYRRQNKLAAIVEYQVVHPRYRIYDPGTPIDPANNPVEQYLIYAERVRFGTCVLDDNGAQIYLQESGARFWSYQYGQSGPPA